MKVKQAIRDLNSSSQIPTRFCDVVVDGTQVYLQLKTGSNFKTIRWEDVVYQVESAKEKAAKEEV